MDYGQLISRSIQITLRQRALWLYGFLLALFSGGGGGGNINLPSGQGTPGTPGAPGTTPIPGLPPGTTLPDLSSIPTGVWATLGVTIAVIVLALIIVSTVLQSVARTALIGMVDQVEETGVTSVGQGWSVGWSRYAWRNFLVNLLLGLLIFVVVIAVALLIGGTAVALGVGLTGSGGSAEQALGSIGGLVCLALACLIPLGILAGVAVTGTLNLAMRHVTLRDGGVRESIGVGWRLFRANLWPVVILLVLLFVIGLVWGLATGLIGIAVGVGLGGIPALFTYVLTQQTWATILAAVPGILVAVVFFAFIGALWAVFQETIWTLFYRQLPNRPDEPAALTPVTPTM
jgi:hypothetical protein